MPVIELKIKLTKAQWTALGADDAEIHKQLMDIVREYILDEVENRKHD